MGEVRGLERLEQLERLTNELATALRVDDVARVLVAAVVGVLGADGAAVWIADGEVAQMLAVDGPASAQMYSSLALDGPSPIATVIATGEPKWVESRAEYAAEYPVYEIATRESSTAMAAWILLPLATRGTAVGALGLAFKGPRAFDKEERAFLLLIAGHAAIAYERARLNEEAARKQHKVEESARRLERLREAMEALAAARTMQQVATVIVEAGARAVDAGSAVVWLVDPADGCLKVAASRNVAEDYLAIYRVIRPDSGLPLIPMTTTRKPLFIGTADDYERLDPELYRGAVDAGQVHPFAALPLATEDRLLGAIAFAFQGAAHAFGDDEREFLFGLTRTCEQALERARLLEAEAQARLVAEAANQRKDEFLAMLGHELRNPLAAMTSAVDLIKVRDGTLGRELTILDRHLTALVRMVDDLLDVSRLTLGKIQLTRTAADLVSVIDQAIENLGPQIEAREHTITVGVPPDVRLNADPDRLVQVIDNLLTNAVQYTPNGGRIEISAREEIDDVVIEIRDNGAGMSPTLMKSIFDAFVQGPRALDRRQGGLGIGLTLVKQLVELHGGRVVAESEGDGLGSTFSVHWPKAAGLARTLKMAKLSRPEPLRVLVVDHEVDDALAFGRAIEGMSHEVIVVHDAPDALAAAARFAAEIVFLDLAVGGYDLAKQLRALPPLQNARIVALGPSSSVDPARASEAGVEKHATKPIDIISLASLLD